jgi:hypothetical protein
MTPLIRICVRYTLLTALFFLPVANPRVHAAQETEEVGHEHSRHHLEATFGAAYNDGKTGSYTGFEYEYRFSGLFGVGAFVDQTFDGFDLAALGVVANFHPAGRWKVLTGLGVERKIGGDKDKALLRVGGAYEFHVGNGTISPTVAYDFIEDGKDVVYAGVAIGFEF